MKKNIFSKTRRMTPAFIVKIFVLLSLGLSLLAGVTDHISPYLFGKYTLSWLFVLHPWGIKQGFLWQLVTHSFIHPTAGGIDLGYLIGLLFSSFLLWKIGSTIVNLKGVKHFLTIFFGSTLVSSLIAVALFFSSEPMGSLSGGTAVVYSLLLAMIMLLPDLDLLLFLTVPVKAKWFILGVMGAFLLIDLSHGNFVHFFSILGSLSFTYLYCLIFWRIHSPFRSLRRMEKVIIGLSEEYFFPNASPGESLQAYAKNAKIYDFKTGRIVLDDDSFMDACLAKIADTGRDSLSWREKFRMKRISKRKKKRSQDLDQFASSRR